VAGLVAATVISLMERPLVSASQFPSLLSSPVKRSLALKPFSLFVVETPLHASVTFADLALGLYVRGRHRIWRKSGGRSVEGWTDPGAINLTPAGFDGTWGASGSSRAITLFVPGAFLSRVIAEHWEREPSFVEILPQFLIRDPMIEALATRLAAAAHSPALFGDLYAESACEFLTHHIIHAHSSISAPPPRCSGGMSGRRLKDVVEFIHEHLGDNISLHHLAALSGVSVRHFERAFKQAVGEPPHAYVLGKRLLAAQDLLLKEPDLSVSEISARVGLSSSSHLASAFRRRNGISPTEFRRIHSS
jgi:AraC family transcriptional regulator